MSSLKPPSRKQARSRRAGVTAPAEVYRRDDGTWSCWLPGACDPCGPFDTAEAAAEHARERGIQVRVLSSAWLTPIPEAKEEA